MAGLFRRSTAVDEAGWGRTLFAGAVSLVYFFPVLVIVLTAFKEHADALAELLHALIDSIIDPYFVVVEALGTDVESLEDKLMHSTVRNAVSQITHFKREALEVRRAIWPTREVINALLRQNTWLTGETQIYLRDVYDHTVHVIEGLDTLRELIGDLLDLHLTTVSNRLNGEVRVLTVVTTLFAPATVITGFFGMNFHHMPLLDDRFGWQLATIGVLVACTSLALMFGWRYWRRD